jgi:MscS family membrane protein
MYRLATLVALSLLARAVCAQLPVGPAAKQPASTKPAEEDPFGRDSPRGCVLGFLRAAERGDYSQAAQYLDTRATPPQAEELARQLQVVLNHGLSSNVDNLSRVAGGNVKDDLRENRDRAGFVLTTFGRLNILLDRIQRSSGPPIWLFSSETLRDVPRAFEEFNAPGIERFIPRILREVKVFSLPLWRWLAIILAVTLALVSAALVTRALIRLVRPAVRRMTGQKDDRYLHFVTGPIRLLFLALAMRVLAYLAISVLARAIWIRVSAVLAIAGFSWLLLRLSDILSELRSRQLLRRQATDQIAILALARRLFKILVLFLGVVILLHGAGVNVSAMLAGLGIGGIALALAAQKTLENLFGGITIITREAVRVGDFCKFADEIGTIEDIGLGSTRVRTLDRTIVSIPNAKVSQMNLENYSMRDRIWFHHVFGLRYDTSPEQVRQVLGQTNEMLRSNPKVERESARIRLIEFGPSSLTLEIFAYITITDYTAFLDVQQDLLLRIMDIIAASGTSIALPSQITYFDRDQWSRADKEGPASDRDEQRNQVQPGETFGRSKTRMVHSAGEP